MKILAALLLSAITAAAPVGLAAAEDQTPVEELQSHIDQINQQIDDENGTLALLDGRVANLQEQLKGLRSDGDKLKTEERALNDKLARIERDRKLLEEEVADLDSQARERRQLSVKRVRAAYMHPPEQAIGDLFKDSQSENFSHLGFYLAAVRSYDRRMVDEMIELSRSRAEKAAELVRLIEDQQKTVQELKVKRAVISKKVSAQEPLVKQLRAEHVEQEKIVTQLRAQLLRFETVLAGLTGGSDERRPSIRPRSPDLEQPSEDSTPFDGQGLAVFKGKLEFPVPGKTLVPFGKEVRAANGIAGSSKGIEMAALAGAPVVAVAAGKVIFYGRMPILGTIVILDHGERYYSLYGRLGSVEVTRGAAVASGALVGKVSEPEPDGRNFYFEIRKNGNPVNPAPFFRQKI